MPAFLNGGKMDIQVNVVGQKLRIYTNYLRVIDGSQNFIRFVFAFDNSWSSLTKYAEFTQDGTSYSIYLDSDSSAYLPVEITSGTCTLTVYGTGSGVIATTGSATLRVERCIITNSESGTDITPTLYEQLVDRVDGLESEIDELEDVDIATESETRSYLGI